MQMERVQCYSQGQDKITVAEANHRRRENSDGRAPFATLVVVLTVIATATICAEAQSMQPTKLAPELLYIDPYTGIAYNYVLTGQIAGPGSSVGLNSDYEGTGEALAAALRHPRAAAVRPGSVKRSAGGPAAVKRERIIMDALGGDYLIRKRTIF